MTPTTVSSEPAGGRPTRYARCSWSTWSPCSRRRARSSWIATSVLYKKSGRKVDAAGSFRYGVRSTRSKAAVAVGHSILVIAWHLLTNGCTYQDLGGDYFVTRDAEQARQRAVSQLQGLGYNVTLEPAA